MKKQNKTKQNIRKRLGGGTLNTCAKNQGLSKTAWTFLDSEGILRFMLEPACTWIIHTAPTSKQCPGNLVGESTSHVFRARFGDKNAATYFGAGSTWCIVFASHKMWPAVVKYVIYHPAQNMYDSEWTSREIMNLNGRNSTRPHDERQ